MSEDIINIIIKSFLINIYTLLIDFKIINYRIKTRDFIKIIFISVFNSIMYSVINLYIDNMLTFIIIYFIQILFLKVVIRNDNNPLFVVAIISNAITYIGFCLSALLELIFMAMFDIHIDIINILIILTIEGILLIGFFRINRFRKGFTFLQNASNHEYIDMIMINMSVAVILAYYIFGNYYRNTMNQLLICLIVLSIIMLITIQKTLTLYYKQKLLSKTIEDYKSEIASKDEQIKKLSDEKFKISKLNHEFYNRQKALEKKVQDFVSNSNIEASSELSIMESINNLSKSYSSELEKIKSLDKLPSTDIEEIDDMFKYMQSECKNNNIDFKLQVNGNIHHMVNKIIPQDRLVTLIGDHLRDAIIAINAGDNKFRSILAILGVKDECYELCIYDSGVEFTIDTLSKLGIEPTTTHKESGGSGIGFMTTFETMKQTGASLIIDEKRKPSANDYTKSVIIKFDGQNEYRIFSYRAKEIKNKIKDNRIIIKDRM